MFRAAFSLLFLSFIFNTSHASEPRNLDLAKAELIRYHDSGEYEKDIAHVVEQAKTYLSERIQENKNQPKKLALVFDIDETALSNYADMLRMNFGGTLKDIEEAEAKSNIPAIKSTLDLYEFAKANGAAVFFITARREIYKAGTETSLKNAGYKNYDGLFLLPMSYHEKSVTAFKANVRKQLIEQGYDVVLSLSDQEGDLRGGYADKTFKLPDPYYLVP
jgi:predicted secreted acid phosphatase